MKGYRSILAWQAPALSRAAALAVSPDQRAYEEAMQSARFQVVYALDETKAMFRELRRYPGSRRFSSLTTNVAAARHLRRVKHALRCARADLAAAAAYTPETVAELV